MQAGEEAWLWTGVPFDSPPLVLVRPPEIASLVDARALFYFSGSMAPFIRAVRTISVAGKQGFFVEDM